MESFCLEDLVHAIKGKLIINNLNFPLIGDISIDSRTIKKGDIYFAIKGNNYDGHDFIKESIKKGAAVIVYSKRSINFTKIESNSVPIIKTDNTIIALGKLAKVYINKFKNVQIIGITGSNGKTTTKEILTSILSKKSKTISNKDNFNNIIGLSLTAFNLTSVVKYAVFEMGTSSYGEIKILSDILRPYVGVITNIGLSHLENFTSLNGVFREKKTLFDNVSKNGFIIINNDDKYLKKIYKLCSKHKIITFSCSANDADIQAKNIKLYFNSIDFELYYNKKSVKIKMPINGKFNIQNALAAASCAISLGISLDEIKSGVENFNPPKMRMETAIKSGIILINDAYNANPSSMQESIRSVSRYYVNKKINLVLGDMLELGKKSIYYHTKLGKFINLQKNIYFIYLIGKFSFHIKKTITNKNVFYTKNPNIILEKLINDTLIDKNYVFLFKASRNMKLEEIYKKFCNLIQ